MAVKYCVHTAMCVCFLQEKRVVNDWKPSTPRGRKASEESDSHRGQSDGGHSPPRRTGSGRVGRGGQRGGGGGGRPERRDREPRTPRDGEPGELGGPGRRGGRRGRGGEGGGGGTPGGMDRKSKVSAEGPRHQATVLYRLEFTVKMHLRSRLKIFWGLWGKTGGSLDMALTEQCDVIRQALHWPIAERCISAKD